MSLWRPKIATDFSKTKRNTGIVFTLFADNLPIHLRVKANLNLTRNHGDIANFSQANRPNGQLSKLHDVSALERLTNQRAPFISHSEILGGASARNIYKNIQWQCDQNTHPIPINPDWSLQTAPGLIRKNKHKEIEKTLAGDPEEVKHTRPLRLLQRRQLKIEFRGKDFSLIISRQGR